MEAFRRNRKLILVCAGFTVVICLAVMLVRPSYAGMNVVPVKPWMDHWLSQYKGQTVKITFVSAPSHLATDLSRISYFRLIEACDAGVVIGFRPNRTVFFPYSQIVSIEPNY